MKRNINPTSQVAYGNNVHTKEGEKNWKAILASEQLLRESTIRLAREYSRNSIEVGELENGRYLTAQYLISGTLIRTKRATFCYREHSFNEISLVGEEKRKIRSLARMLGLPEIPRDAFYH